MPASTYYLTASPPSKNIKKLNSLTGWESDMAHLLLLDDQEDKIEYARDILQKNSPSGEISDKVKVDDAVINMLPKNSRSRAKIFLHHARKFLKETEDGLTILLDGSVSSPMIDILRYYCSPKHISVPLPMSSDLLEAAFKKYSMPSSAFGTGRWSPIANEETFTLPPKTKWIFKR